MKRLFWTILACSVLGCGLQQLESNAESNQGAWYPKAYSVDQARVEAFKDVHTVVDLSEVPKRDPEFLENHKALRRKVDIIGDRMYTRFQQGAYSVSKLCDTNTYYYYPDGRLVLVQQETSPTYYNPSCKESFPKKSYKYSYPSGRLTGVVVDPNNFESFVFAPDESLAFHWVGKQCYDNFSRRCGSRETFQTIPPRTTSRINP